MEVLPSLARAAVARTFDPAIWPLGTAMSGDDVLIAGTPADQLLDGAPSPYPIVVARVQRLIRSGPVVLCDVSGPLPAHHVLADVAWPGARLAGARMRQVLIRSADGARLAVRAEVPVDVAMGGVIALAFHMAPAAGAPGLRSWCVERDELMGTGRWNTWTNEPGRRHDRDDERVYRTLERLA